MLATLTGDLCLMVGLAVLLLPLLATELSRPRDGVWGAVILILGLVLVTSSDRLRGAPMLAVACSGLLISRLGSEVAQSRWTQLSPEEQQRLGSRERWSTGVQQLITALMSLGTSAGALVQSLQSSGASKAPTLPRREGASKTGKRWVRPEPTTSDAGSEPVAPTNPENQQVTPTQSSVSAADDPDHQRNTVDEAPGEASDLAHHDEPAGKGFGAPKQTKQSGQRWVRPEAEAEPTGANPPTDSAQTDQPQASSPDGTGED